MREWERPSRLGEAWRHWGLAGATRTGVARRTDPAVFWLRLALAAWLLGLLGATAGYVIGQRTYDRGVTYGDPGPAMADLDGPQRAINTQLELESDAEAQHRSLKMIKAAGFGWIRQQFQWASIEVSAKGVFEDTEQHYSTWEAHDQIVRLAREEGLRVIARLDVPPEWARPPDTPKTHPPANVQDFGDFVYAFVGHFQGQVDHIQIWNEPNLRNEWGNQPVDPAAYVELLRVAYQSAKRANPAVRVLSGELAQTLEPDHPDAQGLDDLIYLDRMYQHGARPFFDILAANAYGLWTGPEDRQVGPQYTNFPRVLLTRAVMLKHGDGGKAVWVTEFGWNALPKGWQGNPSPWGQVPPERQASYITGAYQRARLEWPWLGPMSLWLFRQPRADPRDPTPYFALVDAAWQPRAAYQALAATADDQPLGPGVHQDTSAGMRFGGTWQWSPDRAASLGGFRETPVSGATLRLRFRGTALDLIAPYGPNRGQVYVKINGTSLLANRLQLNHNGQAGIDFYAPQDLPQRRVRVVDGLPDRVHELELTVAGEHSTPSGGAGVGVDAIVVMRARPEEARLALSAVWAASCGALLWVARGAVLRRWRHRGLPPALPLPLNRWDVTAGEAPLRPPDAAAAGGAVGGASRLADGPSQAGPRWARWARWARWHAGVRFRRVVGGSFAMVRRVPWITVLVLSVPATLWLTPLPLRTPVGSYPLPELLLLGAAALAVGRIWVTGSVREWWGAFTGPAILLLLAGLSSSLVADYPRLALRELRTLLVEPVLFYCLCRGALRSPAGGRWLAAATVAGATVAAVLALGQVVTGRSLVAAEGVARAAALYSSPNNLALVLDRAIPLALAMALYTPWPASGRDVGVAATDLPGRRVWPSGIGWLLGKTWRSGKAWPSGTARLRGRLRLDEKAWQAVLPGHAGSWWTPAGRALWAAATVLCLGALLVTFSRGAWLAVAFGLATVIAPAVLPVVARLPRETLRRNAIIAGSALVPVALGLLAAAWRLERFRSLLSASGTGFLRVYLWQSALRMALDHPLWGAGLDQFLYHYPAYVHPQAWREPNLSHPHNVILDFWLRLGLLGVAALAWTVAIFVHQVRRVLCPGSTGLPRALALGAAGAAVASLVHGLVDNSYFVMELAYLFWATMALVELATDDGANAGANAGAEMAFAPVDAPRGAGTRGAGTRSGTFVDA